MFSFIFRLRNIFHRYTLDFWWVNCMLFRVLNQIIRFKMKKKSFKLWTVMGFEGKLTWNDFSCGFNEKNVYRFRNEAKKTFFIETVRFSWQNLSVNRVKTYGNFKIFNEKRDDQFILVKLFTKFHLFLMNHYEIQLILNFFGSSSLQFIGDNTLAVGNIQGRPKFMWISQWFSYSSQTNEH